MVTEVAISDDIIEQYHRDGVVILRNVFDQQWIDKVKRGIAKNMDNPSKYSENLKGWSGDGAYFNDYCNWQWIEEFNEYIYKSPAAYIAARIMKSNNVCFYHEHVLNKEPGTTKATPWHQDQPYYPIDGNKVCSLWMPVDPVPIEASLKFVVGSHLWSKWFIPRKFASEQNYPLKKHTDTHVADVVHTGSGGEDIGSHRQYFDVPVHDIENGNWPIFQWQCQPGDVIIFHMRTLHGAAGNPSISTQRRVLSTRWLGDDAVFGSRPWDISPPITGGLLPGQPINSNTFPLIYTNYTPKNEG